MSLYHKLSVIVRNLFLHLVLKDRDALEVLVFKTLCYYFHTLNKNIKRIDPFKPIWRYSTMPLTAKNVKKRPVSPLFLIIELFSSTRSHLSLLNQLAKAVHLQLFPKYLFYKPRFSIKFRHNCQKLDLNIPTIDTNWVNVISPRYSRSSGLKLLYIACRPLEWQNSCVLS